MDLFEKKVVEIKVGDYVEGFGEVLNIKKNNIRTQFDFSFEGREYFKTFMNSMSLYCTCKPSSVTTDEIRLDEIELKNGCIIPKCTCGGHIDCIYEGEVTETYHYFCECGAALVIDGYSIDAAMDALQGIC